MNNQNNMHRSTCRVLDILELVSKNPGKLTLTEISEQTDSPKSSLSPILSTLVKREYLSTTSDLRYKLGQAVHEIGASYLDQIDIWDEIEKILTNLTNVCSETSHFGILSGENVLYLKKIDSPENIRMTSRVGNRMPAYGTAIGKALLIDYSLDDLKRLYSNKLQKLTPNTIIDFDVLYNEIKDSRKSGITQEVEESNEYIRCFATPIRQHDKIVAAISVAIPTFRYSDEVASLVKNLLLNAKKRIEQLLNNLDKNFMDLI